MRLRPFRGPSLLFGGTSTLPGGRGSGLPFDGASFEHESCSYATAARLALPGRHFTLRSPRPGVSPPCPEHGGLASFLVGAPSGASPASQRAVTGGHGLTTKEAKHETGIERAVGVETRDSVPPHRQNDRMAQPSLPGRSSAVERYLF